jgi:dihydrodipicolinate synthase/N-acetylneuraminate lyase
VDWRGYIPAITTPFSEKGDLDICAIERLLPWLVQEGMHGVLIAGTQGEWFSLSQQERSQLFEIAGSLLRGRMALIAGCTAFTAHEVIENARVAAGNGFDGIIITPPPYIVPTEEEILGFYRDVNDAVELPICVYNWPPGNQRRHVASAPDGAIGALERRRDQELHARPAEVHGCVFRAEGSRPRLRSADERIRRVPGSTS